MLFVAITFYKGLTGKPCLLNISFVGALVMSIVFLISGFVLLFGISEVCERAEEMLKKNPNIGEDKISSVEESLQSSATALTVILLLVGGVAASSVILSLRMKDKLCVHQLQPRGFHRALSAVTRSLSYLLSLISSVFFDLHSQFSPLCGNYAYETRETAACCRRRRRRCCCCRCCRRCCCRRRCCRCLPLVLV